jgi:dienelactone hydrolase
MLTALLCAVPFLTPTAQEPASLKPSSLESASQDPVQESAQESAQEPASPETAQQGPAEALAAAVDLPTAEQRRKAALELAKRGDVKLDQWLELASSFGEFEAQPAGSHMDEVSLRVGDKQELTRIHYWVPESYDPSKPTPMLLALHGAGGIGLSEMQNWVHIASDLNMLILAPTDAGANMGYSFEPRERQATLAALRWFRRRFNVDENRIHLTGVSRGGHLCWELALRHPQHWASVVPRIGGPALAITGGRNTIRLAPNLAHIPVRLLQGMQDDPKMIVNQNLLFSRLDDLDAVDAKFIKFENLGHSYDLKAVNFAGFFADAVRDPLRAEFSFCTVREDDNQMYWLVIDKLDSGAKEDFQPRVDPGQWNSWDHAQKAHFIQLEANKRTAEVHVELSAPGRFKVSGQWVRKLRLLLPQSMLDEKGRVEVFYKGKTRKKKPKQSSKNLLLHFVEYFDRSFLPVGEVKLS